MQSIPSFLDKQLKKNFTGDNKPQLLVEVTRPRAEVIDTDSWQIETIRSASELGFLGDIAVAGKRERPYGRPSALYDIHIENGNAFIAYKPYPDLRRSGWVNIENLGYGKRVAIGFEGNFEFYRGRWRLVTENEPLVFWTNQNDELYFKRVRTSDAPVKLDDHVTSLSCCQAWRNDAVSRNAGFMLAYVKDGSLMLKTLKQGIWANAFNYSIEDVNDVQISLTNDYRVALMATSISGNLRLYLTDRLWAGMALRPDYVEATCITTVGITTVQRPRLMEEETVEVKTRASIRIGENLSEPQLISYGYPQFEYDTVMLVFDSKIGVLDYTQASEILRITSDKKGDLKPKTITIQGDHLFCTCENAFEDEEGYIHVSISDRTIYTENSSGIRFYFKGETIKFKRGNPEYVAYNPTRITCNVNSIVVASNIRTEIGVGAFYVESTIKTKVDVSRTEDNQI